MAAATQTQAVVVQKAMTVLAPITLGFGDCFALFLGFLLMMMSAFFPGRASGEE